MKLNWLVATLFVAGCGAQLLAQNVGINSTGATPNASAGLDIDFTNRGILIPRVALTATNAAGPITAPATSLMVYNTATAGAGTTAVSPGYYYWDGTAWVRFSMDGNDWRILGNSGTNAALNFIGTTDPVDFAIRTSNVERMRVLANGNVGIGTATPSNRLTVVGGDALLIDAAGTGGWLKGFDDHHSIYMREGATDRINYYEFGNTVAAGGGHRFFTGGVKTAQTLKFQVATDLVQSYLPTVVQTNTGLTGNQHLNLVATSNVTNTVAGISMRTNSGWSVMLRTRQDNSWLELTDVAGNVQHRWFQGNYFPNNTPAHITGLTGPNRILVNAGLLQLQTQGANGAYNILNTCGGNWLNSVTSGIYSPDPGAGCGDDWYIASYLRTGPEARNLEIGMRNDADDHIILMTAGHIGIATTTPVSKLDVMGVHLGASAGTGGNNDGPSQAIIPAGSNGTNRANDWPGGWGGGLSTYDICGSGTFMSTYVTRSDMRLKKDIQSMNTGLKSSFMALRPVTYLMKEETPENKGLQYGFIAQEVRELFPSLVTSSEDPNGTIGMNYQGLIAPTIYVVQEQQKEIDALKKEIEELKRLIKEK